MKKILVLIAALAVVASACSASNEVVASVNGVDIDRSRVDELAPNGEDVRDTEFVQYLTVRIQWEALSQAAFADYGIDPSEDDVSRRLDELVAGQGAGATLEDYLAVTQASEAGIREFTKQLIIQAAIREALTAALGPVDESDVTRELVEFPLDWTVVCASHILVGTEAEAEAVLAQLSSGETFADVAAAVSIDTESGAAGGTLGCGSPTEFSDEIATAALAAEVDVPTDPVMSDFGYHVILVTQREEATPDIVRQALEREAVSTATEDWFTSTVSSADVTVSEDIGTWVTEPTPQILRTR